jgi:hypothetical protein
VIAISRQLSALGFQRISQIDSHGNLRDSDEGRWLTADGRWLTADG